MSQACYKKKREAAAPDSQPRRYTGPGTMRREGSELASFAAERTASEKKLCSVATKSCFQALRPAGTEFRGPCAKARAPAPGGLPHVPSGGATGG